MVSTKQRLNGILFIFHEFYCYSLELYKQLIVIFTILNSSKEEKMHAPMVCETVQLLGSAASRMYCSYQAFSSSFPFNSRWCMYAIVKI